MRATTILLTLIFIIILMHSFDTGGSLTAASSRGVIQSPRRLLATSLASVVARGQSLLEPLLFLVFVLGLDKVDLDYVGVVLGYLICEF